MRPLWACPLVAKAAAHKMLTQAFEQLTSLIFDRSVGKVDKFTGAFGQPFHGHHSVRLGRFPGPKILRFDFKLATSQSAYTPMCHSLPGWEGWRL